MTAQVSPDVAMKELLCGLNCTSSLFGILGFICIYFIKAVGGMGNSPTHI